MSLVSSRLSLIHRCTVERNVNLGTDDGWGNALPPEWETHIEDLPCRAWTAGHETVTSQGTLAVVIEVHLIVQLGTDINDADRIDAITFRDAVIQDGPLAVHAVLARRDHLAVVLAKGA